MSDIKSRMLFLTLAVTVSYSCVFGSQRALLRIQSTDPGRVESRALSVINNKTSVHISGHIHKVNSTGLDLLYYCWVVNSDTRQVVWQSLKKKQFFIVNKDSEEETINQSITLDKGLYEIYSTSIITGYKSEKDVDLNTIKHYIKLFFSDGAKPNKRYRTQMVITFSAEENNVSVLSPETAVDRKLKTAIASIIRVGNSERRSVEFRIDTPLDIRIYALGEATDGKAFDFGWIINKNTGKKVWCMQENISTHAGGASKNIKIDQRIHLEPGRYSLNYMTDDSHSYGQWNSLPPDDPQFWGITIWPASDGDNRIEWEAAYDSKQKPLIDIEKVGSDELVFRGIETERDVNIRVLCFGEADGKQRMADLGYILNGVTGDIVWKMELAKTDYAGGAEKNRMVEDMITLKKGLYIICYETDSSHAYRDWNNAEPYDPDCWGITIWTVDPEMKKYCSLIEDAKVQKMVQRHHTDRSFLDSFHYKVPLSEYTDSRISERDIVVSLVRMGDSQIVKRKLKMDHSSWVRIIAIGEGDRSGMYDYGWIEDAESGNVIWEMRYPNTTHAGGAMKNRLFNGTVRLEKGSYLVYYTTDSSHSYWHWNDSPPRDTERYGITVLIEE